MVDGVEARIEGHFSAVVPQILCELSQEEELTSPKLRVHTVAAREQRGKEGGSAGQRAGSECEVNGGLPWRRQ